MKLFVSHSCQSCSLPIMSAHSRYKQISNVLLRLARSADHIVNLGLEVHRPIVLNFEPEENKKQRCYPWQGRIHLIESDRYGQPDCNFHAR